MNYKKICCVTGSRAEFGILKPLLEKILDNNFNTDLVVTGSHFSRKHGLTIKEIKKDFYVKKEINVHQIQDSKKSKIIEMSKIQLEFADYLVRNKPQLIIIIGDRYEIHPIATAAYMLSVPIVHIHGGEETRGSLDNGIRHAISQLSSFHFVSTNEYKKRLIKMGCNPKRVHNVGALGIERVKNHIYSSRESVEKALNFKLAKKNLLFCFHPPTKESLDVNIFFEEFLKVVKKMKNTNVIITGANSDFGGNKINEMMKKRIKNLKNFYFSYSLGESLFLDVLNQVDLMIGNSSSAFLEASYINLPSINLGRRQEGRVRPANIIDIQYDFKSLNKYVSLALSKNYKEKIKKKKNPYGIGNTSEKILKVLLNIEL